MPEATPTGTSTTTPPAPPPAAPPPATPTTLMGTPPPDAKTTATPEAKPTGTSDTKPPETIPAEGKPAAPVPVPVEVKWAEGLKVDAEQTKAFTSLAGEIGLDSAKAQKVADYYAGVVKAQAAKDSTAFDAQQAKWLDSIKADAELGGANLEANAALTYRAAKHFGGDAFVELLNRTGLGNHPVVFRTFLAVSKAMAEDRVGGTSKPAGPAQADLYAALYPTMFKSKE